jgi:hypothetical protein
MNVLNKSISVFYNKYPDFNLKIFKLCNQLNYSIPDSIESVINTFNKIIYDNSLIVYSLYSFYKKYTFFDYYTYRKSNSLLFTNWTEVDVILHWWINKKPTIKKILKFQEKDILIYPHNSFNLSDGGITVQFYLASILDKMGVRVRIHKNKFNAIQNPLFNNYYNNDFDLNSTVILYCEGIESNPLNAPFTVRWMLSELGQNVPKDYLKNWKKNELVYYFNSEEKMYQIHNKIDNIMNVNISKITPISFREQRLLNANNQQLVTQEQVKNQKLENDSIFKFLTLFYIHPDIKNNNLNRIGYCHSFRKSYYHKNIINIHPKDSFEIKRNHTQINYIEYFNKYKYFISYDPLSFLTIISILCGCISIIYPMEKVSKQDWYKKTAVYEYMRTNNITQLYGIAYGNSQEEIEFAEKTIHLVKIQWDDIIKFNLQTIEKFRNDINKFEKMNNTINNNFFNI